MKQTLYTLLFSTFSFLGFADPDFIYVDNIHDWEEVLSLAEENRKLLYVYYSADDCEPCDFMENSTFDYDEVEDFLNERFISVYIRKGTSFARMFADGFQIQSVPCSLWMTGKEFVWRLEAGSMDNSEIIEASMRASQLTREYPTLLPAALNGADSLSVKDWLDLMYIAGVNNQAYESELVNSFKNSLHLDSLHSEEYWTFVQTYVSDLTSPIYQYIKIDWKQTLGEDFPWESYYDQLYDFNLTIAINRADSGLVENMEYHLLPTLEIDSTQPANTLKMRKLNLWQDYYLGMGDFQTYLETTSMMIEDVEPNSDQMASIIKELTSVSRSSYALDQGLKWINGAIKREATAKLYIIKADVLIVQGRNIDALRVLGDAEELSPSDDEVELIEFLKYVANTRY